MLSLILGIVLWSAVHFIPCRATGLRKTLIEKFGENTYKGSFSIVVLLAIALIVFGWRSIDPEYLYSLGESARPVTILLMIISVILFGAARRPTVIKRFVRHPQLTGLIVWAIAHLVSNGDSRSLVLFGGMGIWALASILMINQRDGEWVKQESPSIKSEIIGLAITLVVFVVLVLAHPWFAGVPIAS